MPPEQSQPPSAPFDDAAILGIPAALAGDPRRQAVSSIQGTVYQAWWSIDAWLQLQDAQEVIYLEGAEDFDVVRSDKAIAVQVKRHAGSISLGTAKAHEALENFWKLTNAEATRQITLHYLTTSAVVVEQDANFDGLSGLEAWRVARTNPEFATKIARYLETKLDAASHLRAFLVSAAAAQVQERLIHRFFWITDQPSLEAVKSSVDDRIAVILDRQKRSLSLAKNVRMYLESRFWDALVQPSSTGRCLTYGDLLRQVEAATTTYLPIALDRVPELIAGAPQSLGLLNLLLQKLPRPPEPLLRRPAITQRLSGLVSQRRAVLLTGTVHKGKTTVAQLVSWVLCPDAWWVNLSGRQANQVDTLFLALAGRIESPTCPSLVILDDLDISAQSHRVYRDSLALLLHRAAGTGRGIILTAQGDSANASSLQELEHVEILDVPELTVNETEVLCIEHGCPSELASVWSPFITGWTRGHPKLIQVRLAELTARGWPRPSASDLTTQSSAVTSARQMARQLLSASVSPATAELVYLMSECAAPVHRSVAIRLAEGVPGLANAGDVVDGLAGKWLERIGGEWFRATALLHGVASEAWSPEKRKQAHLRIHDAIQAKGTLDPSEAAALLLHAYVGNDRKRLALTGMRLQVIKQKEARREVERQILWLPFIALERGQSITDDPVAGAVLRQLQFRVASTLETDCLAQICDRWAEDIDKIAHVEMKTAMVGMMWLSIGFAESPKVPLAPRLRALDLIPTLQDEYLEGGRRFFDNATNTIGNTEDGTPAQAILVCAIRSVRDASSLDDLLRWLDTTANEDVRGQFETMLEWPLVQGLGAFVQTAWSAKHEETDDWGPWLEILTRVEDYATRRNSPRFGREAAKAKATILTEYLNNSDEAVAVLNKAEHTFGPSAVLLEQRANVRFQVRDDEAVLKIWSELTADPTSKAALDPFAYRRAAISAARLKRWDEASEIFLGGAEAVERGEFELTKFGLRIDAALTESLGGKAGNAARILTEAVVSLPAQAEKENDASWEAVQRAAMEVCRTIGNRVWSPDDGTSRVEPGYASTPALKVPKTEPKQAARIEITRAEVTTLGASLGVDLSRFEDVLQRQKNSRFAYVRWLSSRAYLAVAYGKGAGPGFIESIVGFERTIADVVARGRDQLMEPDEGPVPNLQCMPERWLGLLAAGVICAADRLDAHLRMWLEDSNELLGPSSALSAVISRFIDGTMGTSEELRAAVANPNNQPPVRCAAAAKLLHHPLTALELLRLQAFLVSAAVSDGSHTRQDQWNLHAARRLANAWRIHADNAFQFYSPRITIPPLRAALEAIDLGNGTVRSLLIAAANALNQATGEFVARVR